MDMWDTRLVNQLAQHYRVIVFDNRGMGNSTSSDRDYTIPLFADDTAAFMDALGIKKAHVMGWSMGTFVAQELALGYPEKVDKLILYAGAPEVRKRCLPHPRSSQYSRIRQAPTGNGASGCSGYSSPCMAEGEPGPFKLFPESHRNEPGDEYPAAGRSNRGLERYILPVACPPTAAPADHRRTGCHCSVGKLVAHRRAGPPCMGCQDPGWRTRPDVPVPGRCRQYHPHLPCTRDLIFPVHSVFF